MIITGAAGHLGGTIVRLLAEKGVTVRALVLPGETGPARPQVTYIQGDVRKPHTLAPLFDGLDPARTTMIHCAGLISIEETVTDTMRAVNIQGTQNIVDLCRARGVKKLVYTSSVHAIPEGDPWRVIREVQDFSPDLVRGGYAKTKAEATRRVLDAGRAGLNVTVVHPSGIIGPYNRAGNHLVQLIRDSIEGKLPAGVRGGYDFVDVRDVAQGCLLAAERPGSGECYILSNRHYSIADLLGMIRRITNGRRIPVVPMWVARMAAPLLGWMARLRHERPLYTRYSLYTLASNGRFSHDRATRDLGYMPRDLYDTLQDTIRWLRDENGLHAGRAAAV